MPQTEQPTPKVCESPEAGARSLAYALGESG